MSRWCAHAKRGTGHVRIYYVTKPEQLSSPVFNTCFALRLPHPQTTARVTILAAILCMS